MAESNDEKYDNTGFEREMGQRHLRSIERKSDSEVVSKERHDKVIAELNTVKKMLKKVTDQQREDKARMDTLMKMMENVTLQLRE